MQHLTRGRSKGVVPFGKFRLIDFPLCNCVNSDFRRIYVLTQYRSESLTHQCPDVRLNIVLDKIGRHIIPWIREA